MKRLLPVLAVALLLSTTAAFAEEGTGGPPGAPPAQGSGPQGGEGHRKWEGMSEEQKKEKFGEFKAKRIAKIKEHLACVEKASDFDAMKACRPQHPGGGGGWGKRGGGEGRGPGGGGEGRGPGGEGRGGEE